MRMYCKDTVESGKWKHTQKKRDLKPQSDAWKRPVVHRTSMSCDSLLKLLKAWSIAFMMMFVKRSSARECFSSSTVSAYRNSSKMSRTSVFQSNSLQHVHPYYGNVTVHVC